MIRTAQPRFAALPPPPDARFPTRAIGESDFGKTITVKQGQDLTLILPNHIGPWHVVSTDAAFANPSVLDSPRGFTRLGWKTDGLKGPHTLTVQSDPPPGSMAPSRIFTVTINVEP